MKNSSLPEPTWEVALAEKCFPLVDVQLRSGKHICSDEIEAYAFLLKYLEPLTHFYQRYRCDLIQAPEPFFYLRPQTESLIPRLCLAPLDMVIGKVLCLIYLSPEKLKNEGFFPFETILRELEQWGNHEKLFRLIHPRTTGSKLDQQKLKERVRKSLVKLKRLGMVTLIPSRDKTADPFQCSFRVTESIFRFALDIKGEGNPLETLRQLVAEGEAAMFIENETLDLANDDAENRAEEFDDEK